MRGKQHVRIPKKKSAVDCASVAKDCHVHVARNREISADYLRTCLGLGMNNSTIVFCHEAQESRTVGNLRELIAATVGGRSGVSD